MNFENGLHQAIQRRKKLLSVTNAMRLVNGAPDGFDGLLIDRYNKHFCVQVLKDHWHENIDVICRTLTSCMPADYLIVKSRRGLDYTNKVFLPGASRTIVEEYGLQFEVDLNDGLNCGLFLDMRHNRRMVGEFARGKKLLNCFSYTCSFGVHAMSGGGGEAVNSDINRKALERGKNNYRLNGLACAPGSFIKSDSGSFLRRTFKKGRVFDAVVLDPPSFARHEGRVFQVKRELPRLMALAVAVLNPGGGLLVATNYSEISHAHLERFLGDGLNGRRVERIQRVGQDEDFTGTNTFKESYLAGLWVRFR